MMAMAVIGGGMQIMQGMKAKSQAKTNAAIQRADLAEATLRNKEKINKALRSEYKSFSINSLNDSIKIREQNEEMKEINSYVNTGAMNSSVVMEGSSVSDDLKAEVDNTIMMNVQDLERSQINQLSSLENNSDLQMDSSDEQQAAAGKNINYALRSAKDSANSQILSGATKIGTAAAKTDTVKKWEGDFSDKIKSGISNWGK